MFAARLRSSLIPLLHRRCSSSLTRNREIATNSKCISHNRFNGGVRILSSLQILRNRVAFHSSPHYYSTSESDTEVETKAPEFVTSLEDDFLAELGSIVIKENSGITLLDSFVEMPKSLEVEIPIIPQEAIGKKKKKKKKQGQVSNLKLKLLTEKPEVFWKTNVEKKIKARPKENSITVLQLLTEKPKSLEVEIPIISQEAICKKNKDKKEKKKHEQVSDLKLELLTEKPKVFWKTDAERKIETGAKEDPTITVLQLLTEKPKSLEVELPMLPQEALSKKKKEKKHGQVSDSKLKLLTEKPEVFWKTDVKRKVKARAKENPTVTVLQLLTEKPKSLEVEIPMLPQEAIGKKKKHEQVSDLKLKLLTEMPEVFRKTDVKRKINARASTPARNVTDPIVSSSKPNKSSSSTGDQKSKAQKKVSPGSKIQMN